MASLTISYKYKGMDMTIKVTPIAETEPELLKKIEESRISVENPTHWLYVDAFDLGCAILIPEAIQYSPKALILNVCDVVDVLGDHALAAATEKIVNLLSGGETLH